MPLPERKDTAPEPLRVMRWWWVFGGLVLAVLAGAFVIWWLFGEAAAGTPQAKLRIDAIRTGLTVMAGVGGAVTLLFAARRQWLSERAQRHQERVSELIQAHDERVQAHAEQVAAAEREHQERLAAAAERDAAERRVTELFAGAVDHLGSDKPAVRLGGLYSLERLATAHPDQRQPVVDVVCAYLRMEPDPDARHEESVRQAAQRILLRHLKPDGDFWEGVRVDLSGAHLDDFDARGCAFGDVSFRDAVFVGPTHFNEVDFVRPVGLWRANFGGPVTFAQSRWRVLAGFKDVTFGGGVFFDGAMFKKGAVFESATRFGQETSFRGATFQASAVFDRLEFPKVSFHGARFERGASFEHTTFRERVSFRRVGFGDTAMFRWAAFHGEAVFDEARFESNATFGRARFAGPVLFDPRGMGEESWFDDCRITGDWPRVWPDGWREESVDEDSLTLVRVEADSGPG